MSIAAGSDILVTDVSSVGNGVIVAGKLVQTDSNGKIDPNFLYPVKFGGTGADGALSISSGTTTIDLGGAQVVVKNYTSISITSTGKLAFTNPHANGTTIILKSQGNVTITGGSPSIDTRGMGGNLGTGGTSAGGAGNKGGGGGGGAGASTAGNGGGTVSGGGTNGNAGSGGVGFITVTSGGGGVGSTGGSAGSIPLAIGTFLIPYLKMIPFVPGAGGGGGGGGESDSGAGSGGRGGGALYIECGGALNYTSSINVGGNAGSNNTTPFRSGGGGGGGGASCVILYKTLTASSGTTTVTGGGGGTSGGTGGAGGAGGDGYVIVASNTDIA